MHDFLQAKVDAKTRKDLLKYLITRKLAKTKHAVSDEEVSAFPLLVWKGSARSLGLGNC